MTLAYLSTSVRVRTEFSGFSNFIKLALPSSTSSTKLLCTSIPNASPPGKRLLRQFVQPLSSPGGFGLFLPPLLFTPPYTAAPLIPPRPPPLVTNLVQSSASRALLLQYPRIANPQEASLLSKSIHSFSFFPPRLDRKLKYPNNDPLW